MCVCVIAYLLAPSPANSRSDFLLLLPSVQDVVIEILFADDQGMACMGKSEIRCDKFGMPRFGATLACGRLVSCGLRAANS